MGDGIDYRSLAMRIRAAKDRAAARDNPQRLAEGGVKLAEVLDLLTSATGTALVEGELTAEAHKALDGFERDGAHAGMDPFHRGIARFFEMQSFAWSRPTVRPDLVPQAVVEAFAFAAGSGGVITDEIARKKLGPVGLRVLQKCRALLEEGPPSSDRPASKLEDLGAVAAEELLRSRQRPSPLAGMPVLKDVSFGIGGPNVFRGFSMAAVQHLFPSTEGLFRALTKNGLEPRATIIGGKGYSTDAETSVALQKDGYGVHHLGAALAHGNENAEDVVAMMARDELRILFHGVDPARETRPRFLLLDEGGKLIKLLHESPEFQKYAHLCVAVEQTDRGIQIIEDMQKRGVKLACPVVNMARSEAKKVHESPMIGESCVYNVEQDLADMGVDITPKVAAVIGYGAVGKATADRLRARGFEVWVYDTDPTAMARAAADGCTAGARDDVIAHGHLLYGCTGRGALTDADYAGLPDGAILANAASGNHELGEAANRVHEDTRLTSEHGDARSTFRGKPVNLGEAVSPMRHGVVRTQDGKELLLMRSGYVCNMGRDIPPAAVQLIRGLLLASCIQATRETKPGLVDLNAEVQKLVVSRVEKTLADHGTSLQAPDFRKVPG